jgi:glycosyltransferase involved in cell wall biosynthesis
MRDAESPPRLRVLFLAQLFPWPLNFGARQRLFHLARGLAAGHEVTMVALDANAPTEHCDALRIASGVQDVVLVRPDIQTPPDPERSLAKTLTQKLRSLDARLRSPLPTFVRDMWSADLLACLTALREQGNLDVVYANRSWMAEHARAAGFPRIVVDVDDLFSQMLRQRVATSVWHRRRLVQLFDAAKSARYERSLSGRFDHVVVVKEEDRDFFPASDRDNVSVVPNGVAIPAQASAEPASADRILFVGALGYGPNIDAAWWFASEIMPRIWASRPQVQLTIAGYGSADHLRPLVGDPRIEIRESPVDLGPLYAGAAVVVAPVRMGGGTRIKILDALARGRALLSTTFAAEGLGLQGGVHLEYADTPADMASRALELLDDEPRRRRLGAAGRTEVAVRFDWTNIERTLPALISGMMPRDEG